MLRAAYDAILPSLIARARKIRDVYVSAGHGILGWTLALGSREDSRICWLDLFPIVLRQVRIGQAAGRFQSQILIWTSEPKSLSPRLTGHSVAWTL